MPSCGHRFRQKSQGRAVLMAHTVSLAPEQQPEDGRTELASPARLGEGESDLTRNLPLRPRDAEQSLEAESTKVHSLHSGLAKRIGKKQYRLRSLAFLSFF